MDERKKIDLSVNFKVLFQQLAVRSNVKVRRLNASRGWTLLQKQLIIISVEDCL